MKKKSTHTAHLERRHPTTSKSSPLPLNYIQMVEEVFSNHFDQALQAFQAIRPQSRFLAAGAVFAEEVVTSVSLVSDSHLAATTVHASADFDPKASSPTIQDLLSACVDALGTVWAAVLDAEKPEALANLAEESLSALDNVPFEWVAVDSNNRKIFVKLDKANPLLDQMADDWLKSHDPNYAESLEEEQAKTEKLFVTGPSSLTIQRPGKKKS